MVLLYTVLFLCRAGRFRGSGWSGEASLAKVGAWLGWELLPRSLEAVELVRRLLLRCQAGTGLNYTVGGWSSGDSFPGFRCAGKRHRAVPGGWSSNDKRKDMPRRRHCQCNCHSPCTVHVRTGAEVVQSLTCLAFTAGLGCAVVRGRSVCGLE